jgi:hypothetical protein
LDNGSAHIFPAVIQLLSKHHVEVIIFPPNTSGFFRMLDLVFFVVFKRVKKHLVKDPSRPVTEKQATQMFKACESAGASSTVRASFIDAGFISVRGADGGYTHALDEAQVRRTAEFREVWGMDYT